MIFSKKRVLFLTVLTGGLTAAIFWVSAATNISSLPSEHWAWNDSIGWVDFDYYKNVSVFGDRIEGFASSSMGAIGLNCNSTPNGDICGISDFKVSNDGGGGLSGWAWNDNIGWISFDCYTLGTCAVSDYQVRINSSGRFSGWAWNDLVGWFSFDCNNTDSCETSDYKVITSWQIQTASGTLLSSVFDTGVANGAAFNNIVWQGSKPSGTQVGFQFASADTAEPATFPEPVGPNGTTSLNDVYTAAPDTPVKLNVRHNNHRYYRYKIILESDALRTNSPRIDDVIVNWSP